jgi:hypothetical protein
MTRREKSSRRAPSERVVLCDRLPTGRLAGIQCVIDRDLIIRPDDLGRYCLKALDPLIYDLVYIAGAVAFADRAVPRRIAICWRRELEVVVPVSDPDFWRQPTVVRTLTETLELLTGDTWSFQFSASKKKPRVDPQAKFPFGWESSVVMPYSNGLDSFATERLTRRDSPKIGVINVTTGRRSLARKGQPQYRVSIPFSPRGNYVRLREISYRSRGFVFGVMAGIAANLLGADSIIIPESGQGAFGPWLNPVGNEAPDVRMHPFFTASLSKFLMAVFKRPIKAEHPRLWNTKGETLKELRSEGLQQEWWRTKSCPRGRKVCLNHVRVPLCANMTETPSVTAISEQGGKENTQHGNDERQCESRDTGDRDLRFGIG